MKGVSALRLFLVLLLAHGMSAGPAAGHGGHSRWGDFGAEILGGSFQLGFQKRLSQGGLEQVMCKVCAHYMEGWVELDELDDGPIDRDVTAYSLGYRYYPITGDMNPRKREGLALFLRVGLSRVKLDDPNATASGYYGGLGVEYPLTQSHYQEGPNEGDLRPFWMSLLGSVTQNEVERSGSNLDYVSAKIGLRFVFPSKRDRRRTECLRARYRVIEQQLTPSLVAGLSGGEGEKAIAAIESEFARLDVFEKAREYAREIEMLFQEGKLRRPSECHEPYR